MELRNYTRLKWKIKILNNIVLKKLNLYLKNLELKMSIRKMHLIIITTGRLNGRSGCLALWHLH